MNDEQRQKQIDLEKQSRKEAQIKYDEEITKDLARDYYSNTKAGRTVIHQDVRTFGEYIYADNQKRLSQQVGRTNARQVAKPIRQIIEDLGNSLTKSDLKLLKDLFKTEDEQQIKTAHGCYALAMIGLKTIYDFYHKQPSAKITIAEMAVEIGSRVEDEIAMLFYYRTLPPKITAIGRKKAQDPYATPKNRRYAPIKLMRNLMLRNGETFEEFVSFSKDLPSQIGIYIMELATRCQFLDPQNKYDSDKQRQQKVVYAGSRFKQLQDLDSDFRSKSMIDKPLLIPPDDWVKGDEPDRLNRSGGYFTKFAKRRKQLCRSWYSDTRFSDMTYELINRLQKVAWQIDTEVYKVALHLMDKEGEAIGNFYPIPPPVQPNVRDESLTEQEKIKRNVEKRKEHDRHIKKVKQYMRTGRMMVIAKEFFNKPEFYYPWSCDWRGRLYPAVSAPLQIQGTDVEKALLKFRDGCELTESGRRWAKRAIGGAVLGTSTSYEERQQWTEDNQELIHYIANDPTGTVPQWEVFKEPWQALQLMLEWNAVEIEKTQDLWYIPVGIDSTASGLQLLSGILRDEQGMRYANLLPSSDSEKPKDAYTKVLELAREDIKGTDKEYLDRYLHDRKVGKPSVMLSVYGGSFPTIRDRLEEYFEDQGVSIDRKDVNAVTQIVINASKKTFPAAYKALSWLRKAARESLKVNTSLTWNTGAGDEIHLVKSKLAIMTVHTEILGKINICLGEQNDAPDVDGMVDSFAPSWVHTLDSNLVKYAFHDFNKPFSLIHDCLVCDCNSMSAAVDKIKGAFRRVCSENSLEQLAEDLGVEADSIDNPLPPKGDDSMLNLVAKSKYLFN